MERVLSTRHRGAWRNALAATLAGVVTAPALAASSFTLPGALSDFTLREWLLATSLLLLVIALVARLVHRHHASARDTMAAPQVEDLRWWRNPVGPEAS